MMAVERESETLPALDTKNAPVPHPQTMELIKASIRTVTWSKLEPEKRDLLSNYYFRPGINASDLISLDPARKTSNIRGSLLSSLKEVWTNLPRLDQNQIDPNFAIKLKHHTYSVSHREQFGNTFRGKKLPEEHRRKMSESRKGKRHKESTKKTMSEKGKQIWKDPNYRERMHLVFQQRHPETQLWLVAQSDDLLAKIVEANMMTLDEIATLEKYFRSKRKKGPKVDSLLDRFSIAVAKVA